MNNNIRDIILKNKSINDFEISTHISLPNKYCFTQVSKAASSSVKWALQSLECRNSPWGVIDVNNKFFSPHISPYQIDDAMLEVVLTSDDFKRATFVRNPYTRILSCYLHRVVSSPNSASNKALIKATGGRGGDDVSFDEFVDVICNQKSIEQECHWRCQSEDLCCDYINYDFIGKLENLPNDLFDLIELLYGKEGLKWYKKSKKKDASPMKTGASDLIKKYYNDVSIQNNVKDRFSKDFELFGYSEDISYI